MDPSDGGLVPFQKLDYDTEAIKGVSGELQALAGRIQRYSDRLYGELIPILDSDSPQLRADAAGRASCLSQEIAAEIETVTRSLADVPLVFNWTEGGRTPPVSLDRLRERGCSSAASRW